MVKQKNNIGNGSKEKNKLIRVSDNFKKKLDSINDKRKELGFDELSNPKITELITRHKKCWNQIEQDLIYFNTKLDYNSSEQEGDFNEK